jgi:hypothetical protein
VESRKVVCGEVLLRHRACARWAELDGGAKRVTAEMAGVSPWAVGRRDSRLCRLALAID